MCYISSSSFPFALANAIATNSITAIIMIPIKTFPINSCFYFGYSYVIGCKNMDIFHLFQISLTCFNSTKQKILLTKNYFLDREDLNYGHCSTLIPSALARASSLSLVMCCLFSVIILYQLFSSSVPCHLTDDIVMTYSPISFPIIT